MSPEAWEETLEIEDGVWVTRAGSHYLQLYQAWCGDCYEHVIFSGADVATIVERDNETIWCDRCRNRRIAEDRSLREVPPPSPRCSVRINAKGFFDYFNIPYESSNEH